MNFIVKYHVLGETRAHILIWLFNKIRPDKIDNIISAEILASGINPELFDVITKNMIHVPCGVYNINSPCMVDGKCSNRYPRALISQTITGNEGYPKYRRRSTNQNGKSIILSQKSRK